MKLKRNLLALTLALLGAAPLLWAQSEKLSLEDALDRARAHNRSVAAAAFEVKRAKESKEAAATQRLPSFAVSADFGQLLTRPYLDLKEGVLGTNNGVPLPDQSLRLSMTRTPSVFGFAQAVQPLSRQYQIGLEIKALDINRQIGEERLSASKQQIAYQVRSAYAQLIDETHSLEAVEADIALYTELERVTEAYMAERTILRSELLQVQARLLHAKYDQTVALNSFKATKEQLNVLMGRDPETAFDVDLSTDLDIVLPTPGEAIAKALRQRSDLKEAQLQIERADLDRRAKKAEYIPDVSLAATYLNLSGSGLPIGGGGYAEIGVQLKWEPFDWGRKHHEMAEKAAVVSEARLTAHEMDSKVRVEVATALRDLQAAQQLLGSVVLDEQAANESLRVIQAKYAERAALLDEVLKAQSTCAQARQQVDHARAAVRTDYAALLKAMGEDL